MGTQELHLTAPPPARRFLVAGESMEFFLRTGDTLYAGAAGGRRARAGDMVLCMGRDAPVLAHRVLLRRGWGAQASVLTKGDFHLCPDGFAAPSAVVGRVLVVERGERRVWLGCRPARAAGAALAAYALAGVLFYRATQLLCWGLRALALRLWSAEESLRGGPLHKTEPAAWRRWAGLQRRLETAHLTFARRLLRRPAALVYEALARHSERAHADEVRAAAAPAPREGAVTWVAGEIAGRAEWSGEVRVFGDVVVLPGASLTIRPGTRVLILSEKRFAHAMARRREGAGGSLSDSKTSSIAVYGRLCVEGLPDSVVRFEAESGRWGGIVLLGRGPQGHSIRHAELSGAARGVLCADEADAELEGVRFFGSEGCGARCEGRAVLRLSGCRFEGGDEGLCAAESARAQASRCAFVGTRIAIAGRGFSDLRFEDCAVDGRAAARSRGISLEEDASCEVSGGEVAGCETGLLLGGRAQVRTRAAQFRGNGTGVELAEKALILAGDSRVLASLGHGVRLGDAVRAEFAGVEIAGSRDNGIYLTGAAKLELSGGELKENRCGLACAQDSSAAADKTVFAGNAEVGVSLTGGEHRFTACEVSGSKTALSASGRARVELESCRFSRNEGEALSLAGEAFAKDASSLFEANKTGIGTSGRARVESRDSTVLASLGHGVWLREASQGEFARTRIEGSKDNGIYLTGESKLNLTAGALTGNRCGLACAERSAASAVKAIFAANPEVNVSLTGGEHRFSECELSGSETGMSVVGRARVELESCRLAHNEGDGLSVTDEAFAQDARSLFESNKTGIDASGRSRVVARSSAVRASRSHGVWLRDASAAELAEAEIAGSRDNGIYLSGSSKLELSGGELGGNRCGLACADESAACAVRTAFCENAEVNVSLAGGEHILEGCSLEGGGTGVSVVGRARLGLAGCRIAGSAGEGLALAGEASVRDERSLFENNKTGIDLSDRSAVESNDSIVRKSLGHGIWLRDESQGLLKGGEIGGNADNGIYLTGRSRLELAGGQLEDNRCGLACSQESSVAVDETIFEGNAEVNVSLTGGEHRFTACDVAGSETGVSAAGRARVSLASCRFSRNSVEGLSLADEAQARDAGSRFENNKTGIGASDRARVESGDSTVEASLGHGVWLRDASQGEFARARIKGSKDNGIYLTGRSQLSLSAGELAGNRCGLACAEDSRAAAAKTIFSGNAEVGVSLTGGQHRLSACEVSDSPVGLVLQGAARAESSALRLLRNGRGAVLSGRARAVFDSGVWAGNETGLWAQEESSCRVRAGSFSRQGSQSARGGQSAVLEFDRVRFSRSEMAVLLEDGAAACVAGCVFRGNPTGVKADGGSRLTLKGSRLRGCRTDGAWLGAQASATLANNAFFGNRVGVHYHLDARIEMAHNKFAQNECGDACCFSRCSCPPAQTQRPEGLCLSA
ncbi:MAG: right-handed parallel beta-helix repeat-containing protein [Elusimicrobia bacterium]|nr:right-handed parallel beta-helix repeat-containing protein [Elusimicrobiota bacterium]